MCIRDRTPASEATSLVKSKAFEEAVEAAREFFKKSNRLLGKIIIICDGQSVDAVHAAEEAATQYVGDDLPPIFVIALQLGHAGSSGGNERRSVVTPDDMRPVAIPNVSPARSNVVFVHRRSLSQDKQKEELRNVLLSVLNL